MAATDIIKTSTAGCYIPNMLRTDPGGIGDELAQMRVVGFIQLIFDDGLVFAIRAQNVQLEVADPVLDGHQQQLA